MVAITLPPTFLQHDVLPRPSGRSVGLYGVAVTGATQCLDLGCLSCRRQVNVQRLCGPYVVPIES